ncbi:Uncharacterised protein [Leminorella grimontii]|nr:Uncharacterised protein [Leminorella grimontii]
MICPVLYSHMRINCDNDRYSPVPAVHMEIN